LENLGGLVCIQCSAVHRFLKCGKAKSLILEQVDSSTALVRKKEERKREREKERKREREREKERKRNIQHIPIFQTKKKIIK